MTSINISIKKHIVKYGVIYGFFWIIYGIIRYSTGYGRASNWWLSTVELFIHISVIIYGLDKYKSLNNGFLKLSEALKIGIGITFMGHIIGMIWHVLLKTVIDPEILNQILEAKRDQIIQNNPNISSELLSQKIKQTKYYSIFWLEITLLGIYSLIGILVSLIAGAIMHKKRKL